MIYDPQYVSRFYDSYSNLEWNRLEKSAYGRLQSLMHTEMLGRYCHKGYRVLDAGCGPGRFSIEAAKLGARVTAFDISPGQLRIAREKIVEAGFIDSMDAFVQGDVSNMNQFNDGDFDLVLAIGGALSYVRELRYQAANELVRVVKSGGMLLVSVMSRIGIPFNVARLADPKVLNASPIDYWNVIKTGDLEGIPSRVGISHPPMHLYSAEELRELFSSCDMVEVAGSNVVSMENSPTFEAAAKDPAAWEMFIRLEKELNRVPGLVDTGSHIMMVLRRGN